MWIKIDDQFPDHPKIRSVGALGLALQMAAICYCGRYLTDGFLSYSAADALIRSVFAPFTKEDGSIWQAAITSGHAGEDADECDWKRLMVESGLWENSRKGGYYIHDYLKYNPKKSEVLAQRDADRKRKGFQLDSARNPDAPSPSSMRSISSPSPDFLEQLKNNPAYKGINVDQELHKMDVWLASKAGRGRKKTERFVLGWLNRIDTALPAGQSQARRLWDEAQREKEGPA